MTSREALGGTTAVFADNRFYGHAHILAEWCGLSEPRPMAARLQHGWQVKSGFIDRFLAEPWPKLVWSERNLVSARQAGAQQVYAVGAPFSYLLQMHPPAPAPPGDGLLAVPFHGWEARKVMGDLSAYADELERLRAEGFGPIIVCLYWLDIETYAELFESRGFEVVTNGPRDDNPDFLRRQLRLFERVRWVTSNRIATASFYAAACGRRFFLRGAPTGLARTDDPDGRRFDAWSRAEFPEFEWARFRDAHQASVAERELGEAYLRPPPELARLLSWHSPLVNRAWQVRRALRKEWRKVLGLRGRTARPQGS